MADTHKTEKIAELLREHKASIIEHLGASAFDMLTPREVAAAIGIKQSRIPDLIRHGWLDFDPEKDIGSGHQYARWRVEFVKRHKVRYKKSSEIPA